MQKRLISLLLALLMLLTLIPTVALADDMKTLSFGKVREKPNGIFVEQLTLPASGALEINLPHASYTNIEQVGISENALEQASKTDLHYTLPGGFEVTIPFAAIAEICEALSKSDNDCLWVRGYKEGQSVKVMLWLDGRYMESVNLTNYVTVKFTGTSNQQSFLVRYEAYGSSGGPQSTDINPNGKQQNNVYVYTFPAKKLGAYEITPKWNPGSIATPTGASATLKALYDQGFKCPRMDVDFNLGFPKELVKKIDTNGDDWDYDYKMDPNTGVLTVTVNPDHYERWKAAFAASEENWMGSAVHFRTWFGPVDNGMPQYPYGYDQYGGALDPDNLSGLSLHEGYAANNGLSMFSANTLGDWTTFTTTGKPIVWSFAICMDDEDGKTAADAEVRYAFDIHIVSTKPANFSAQLPEVPADMPASRMRAVATEPGWTVKTEDGHLRIYPNDETIADAIQDQDIEVASLTPTAPAGYHMKQWTFDGWKNDITATIPIPFTQICNWCNIIVDWESNRTNEILREKIRVEYTHSQSWAELLSELDSGKQVTGAATINQLLTSEQQKRLADNGISVEYDRDYRLVSVSIPDPETVKDTTVLTECVTVPNPFSGATHFRTDGQGGYAHPSLDGKSFAADAFNRMNGATPTSIANDGLPREPLISTGQAKLADGIEVYFADSQIYNTLTVQWLKEDGEDGYEVLGYSYVSRHNDDFAQVVSNKSVNEVNEEVNAPTLIGKDMTLVCGRYPVVGDASTQLFQLSVDCPDKLKESDNEIYLPYEYFDLTKEQALAWKEAPVIRHYSEDCATYTDIVGEYTEFGIKFTTDGFSPFTVRVGAAGTHKISVTESTNGTVALNSAYYVASGTDVTLTVFPEKGYKVGSVVVKGGATAVTDNGDNTYTFTMPDSDVTVTVNYVMDVDELDLEMLHKVAAVTVGVVAGVVITKTVVDWLRETRAAKTVEETVPAINAEEMPVVAIGDSGDAVTTLQTELNAQGYDCGEADGVFGQNTLNAVMAFQTAKGLTADGVVGAQTWTALL